MPRLELWEGFSVAPTAAKAAVEYLGLRALPDENVYVMRRGNP